MKSSIILERVKEFQETPYGHPFTCRERCMTPRIDLIGTELNGNVVLFYPNCGYVQELPEGVFDSEDWD